MLSFALRACSGFLPLKTWLALPFPLDEYAAVLKHRHLRPGVLPTNTGEHPAYFLHLLLSARLLYFQSYRYSGALKTVEPFTDEMLEIKQLIEKELGVRHVAGWHAAQSCATYCHGWHYLPLKVSALAP